MDKFFKRFGIVALAIVCLACAGAGLLVHQASALDGESRAYAEAALPAITSTWDQQALLDRASPSLKAMATPAQVSELFGKLSPLGAIVSFEPPKGQATVFYGTTSSETAAYVIKAKFANGEALVKMALVKADGHWMINGFHVQSLGRLTASRA